MVNKEEKVEKHQFKQTFGYHPLLSGPTQEVTRSDVWFGFFV